MCYPLSGVGGRGKEVYRGLAWGGAGFMSLFFIFAPGGG